MNFSPTFPNVPDFSAASGMVGLGNLPNLLNFAHYAEIGLPMLLFSVFFFRYVVRAALCVLFGAAGGHLAAHVLDLVVIGILSLTFYHDPASILRWAVAFGRIVGGPPTYG